MEKAHRAELVLLILSSLDQQISRWERASCCPFLFILFFSLRDKRSGEEMQARTPRRRVGARQHKGGNQWTWGGIIKIALCCSVPLSLMAVVFVKLYMNAAYRVMEISLEQQQRQQQQLQQQRQQQQLGANGRVDYSIKGMTADIKSIHRNSNGRGSMAEVAGAPSFFR